MGAVGSKRLPANSLGCRKRLQSEETSTRGKSRDKCRETHNTHTHTHTSANDAVRALCRRFYILRTASIPSSTWEMDARVSLSKWSAPREEYRRPRRIVLSQDKTGVGVMEGIRIVRYERSAGVQSPLKTWMERVRDWRGMGELPEMKRSERKIPSYWDTKFSCSRYPARHLVVSFARGIARVLFYFADNAGFRGVAQNPLVKRKDSRASSFGNWCRKASRLHPVPSVATPVCVI